MSLPARGLAIAGNSEQREQRGCQKDFAARKYPAHPVVLLYSLDGQHLGSGKRWNSSGQLLARCEIDISQTPHKASFGRRERYNVEGLLKADACRPEINDPPPRAVRLK
jgi:hypothetical protein